MINNIAQFMYDMQIYFYSFVGMSFLAIFIKLIQTKYINKTFQFLFSWVVLGLVLNPFAVVYGMSTGHALYHPCWLPLWIINIFFWWLPSFTLIWYIIYKLKKD